jgi:hypothetical protein
MIYSCPICGVEFGVTHGDQLWTKEICAECQSAIDKGEIQWPVPKVLNAK